jgi:hypothetical protein
VGNLSAPSWRDDGINTNAGHASSRNNCTALESDGYTSEDLGDEHDDDYNIDGEANSNSESDVADISENELSNLLSSRGVDIINNDDELLAAAKNRDEIKSWESIGWQPGMFGYG